MPRREDHEVHKRTCGGIGIKKKIIERELANIISENIFVCLFVSGATAPQWARASSFTRFLDHTQRRTTVGRTPPDALTARRRDLYLTTHNTNNRQTSMPPVRFEPTISAGERPQTYAFKPLGHRDRQVRIASKLK